VLVRRNPEPTEATPRRSTAAKRLTLLAACVAVAASAWTDPSAETSTVHRTPSTTAIGDGQRFASQSSADTLDGAAFEFAEGLVVRITGATRLDGQLSRTTRRYPTMSVIRIDFSYTNNGSAVNISEGRQLPVRVLYGAARDEALPLGGYVGTSGQLTRNVPTQVDQGATVDGAVSFAVPAVALDEIAILVVEPRRYSEHLFTDVDALLDPRAADGERG
jgi:hypothetical protein